MGKSVANWYQELHCDVNCCLNITCYGPTSPALSYEGCLPCGQCADEVSCVPVQLLYTFEIEKPSNYTCFADVNVSLMLVFIRHGLEPTLDNPSTCNASAEMELHTISLHKIVCATPKVREGPLPGILHFKISYLPLQVQCSIFL